MDLAAFLAGSEHDRADERAKRLSRFPAAMRIVERFGEPDHVLPGRYGMTSRTPTR
jgi:hypothetical protein